MKQFNEIFGKVMIEITPEDVAVLGTDVPVVVVNDHYWVEFTTWANKAFSPNLELGYAYSDGSGCCIMAKVNGSFTEKSASTLKANGFTEYAICADTTWDDEGHPLYDAALILHIPYVPSI